MGSFGPGLFGYGAHIGGGCSVMGYTLGSVIRYTLGNVKSVVEVWWGELFLAWGVRQALRARQY